MRCTRRSALYITLLTLPLVIAVALIYWSRQGDFGSDDLPSLLPADTLSLTRIELLRDDDTLFAERGPSGGWLVRGAMGAASQTVRSLFEFLAAIRVEFPIPLVTGDTVADYATSVGIRVSLAQGASSWPGYTLAPWPGGRILLYAPQHHRAYVASAAGYSPSLLQSLSLRPENWVTAKLYVGLPSDISSVELRWLDGSDPGFRVTIDSALRATMTALALRGPSVAYDTAKLASFLYSLTELPYEPLPDSLQAWYQESPGDFPPVLSVRIDGVQGSYAYRVAHLPLSRPSQALSGAGAPYDAQRALLLVEGMGPKLISLSQWDAAMPRLRDLQPR